MRKGERGPSLVALCGTHTHPGRMNRFFFFLLLDAGKAGSCLHLPVAGTVLGTRHLGRERGQGGSAPPLCARLTSAALCHEGGGQARLPPLANWRHRAQRLACPRPQSGRGMDRARPRDRVLFSSLPAPSARRPPPPPDARTPRLRLVLRLLSAPLASSHGLGLVSLRGPSRSPGSHVHSARPRPRGRGGQAASSGTPALGTGALTSQKGREPACRAEVALSARRPLRRVGPSGPRPGRRAPAGLCPAPGSWDYLSDTAGTCVPFPSSASQSRGRGSAYVWSKDEWITAGVWRR